MRGYPQFNFPAFNAAALRLECAGHTVFNPAARDNHKYGIDFADDNDTGCLKQAEEMFGFSLREALANDTKWICEEATAIYMLKGWTSSYGAVAEHALAEALSLKIWYGKGAMLG
jgi:hypothetical protein